MAATPETAPALRAVETTEALYNKLSPGPGRSAREVASHQRARLHGAMIEIVGSRGYSEVTVRELSRLAGVSTRAFYAHFQDKDECLLRTYDLVVQQAAAQIVAAQSGEHDWLQRIRRAFAAFAEEIARKPRAARLALVEPYAVGPAAVERMLRTDCLFETMLAESLARAPESPGVPPLLIKGMVAGISRVAQTRLISGREREMPALSDGLVRWTLSFHEDAASELDQLDSRRSRDEFALEPPAARSGEDKHVHEDDRALILTAVAKLAASQGYGQLTVTRIRSAAGVSRRSFNTHFDGVKDCFLTAVELRATGALEQAAADKPDRDWANNVYTTIGGLCARIAADPLLANLAFADIFTPGPAGLRCRERIVTRISESFTVGGPGPERGVEALAAEASAAAVWAILHHYVIAGRTQELPRLVPTLSYLVLAPAVGATAATEAIRRKRERH